MRSNMVKKTLKAHQLCRFLSGTKGTLCARRVLHGNQQRLSIEPCQSHRTTDALTRTYREPFLRKGHGPRQATQHEQAA